MSLRSSILFANAQHMPNESHGGRSMVQDSTYVLNVVVSSKHRGQGIGSMLMAAAAGMARDEWSCNVICAHVSAQNDVRP